MADHKIKADEGNIKPRQYRHSFARVSHRTNRADVEGYVYEPVDPNRADKLLRRFSWQDAEG